MKRHEQRRPATEASQRLERAEVRLSQLRADLYLGQVERSKHQSSAALALVEAALDTYMAFFYPPASSQ